MNAPQSSGSSDSQPQTTATDSFNEADVLKETLAEKQKSLLVKITDSYEDQLSIKGEIETAKIISLKEQHKIKEDALFAQFKAQAGSLVSELKNKEKSFNEKLNALNVIAKLNEYNHQVSFSIIDDVINQGENALNNLTHCNQKLLSATKALNDIENDVLGIVKQTAIIEYQLTTEKRKLEMLKGRELMLNELKESLPDEEVKKREKHCLLEKINICININQLEIDLLQAISIKEQKAQAVKQQKELMQAIESNNIDALLAIKDSLSVQKGINKVNRARAFVANPFTNEQAKNIHANEPIIEIAPNTIPIK